MIASVERVPAATLARNTGGSNPLSILSLSLSRPQPAPIKLIYLRVLIRDKLWMERGDTHIASFDKLHANSL